MPQSSNAGELILECWSLQESDKILWDLSMDRRKFGSPNTT